MAEVSGTIVRQMRRSDSLQWRQFWLRSLSVPHARSGKRGRRGSCFGAAVKHYVRRQLLSFSFQLTRRVAKSLLRS